MHVGICNMHVETQHLFLMEGVLPAWDIDTNYYDHFPVTL
jgi:hypothetical protein